MTLTGSLKNDFFIAIAAVVMLGLFTPVGGILSFLQMPLLLVAIFSMMMRNSAGGRMIPGNVEFIALTILAGMAAMKVVSVGAILMGGVVGIAFGAGIAGALIFFAPLLGDMFMRLIQTLMAMLNVPPQFAMLAFILLFFLVMFVVGAISPLLSVAMSVILWGYWAQQRGSQLTGWNDTAN